jgi:hypothetical protein
MLSFRIISGICIVSFHFVFDLLIHPKAGVMEYPTLSWSFESLKHYPTSQKSAYTCGSS